MCARLLACPLCSQPGFLTLDALRAGLVSVATRPLICPVCNEVLLGIDKLTIHLFGHTINLNNNTTESSKRTDVSNEHLFAAHNAHNIALHDWNVLKSQQPDKVQTSNNTNSRTCVDSDVLNIDRNSIISSQPHGQELPAKSVNQYGFTSDYNYDVIKVNILSQSNENHNALPRPATNPQQETLKTNAAQYFCNDGTKHLNMIQGNMHAEKPATSDLIATTEVTENTDTSICRSIERKCIETNSGSHAAEERLTINLIEKENDFSHFQSIQNVPTCAGVPVEKSNDKHSPSSVKDTALKTNDQNQNSEHRMLPHPQTCNIKVFRSIAPKEKTERCNICGFHFPDANILTLHKQLVHDSNTISGKVLKNYSCYLCSKVFKMRGSLMVHMRVAHIGHNSGSLPKDGQVELAYTDAGYACPTCGKKFRKEQHVVQHLKTHEGKQWECDTCSKMFTTKYFLKKHKRLHSGEMPYKCKICDKSFTFQQSYHKHRLYHKDDKPHTCATCGRSFKELSTLHNHERIHTGEKPFACETCGKCFRQRVSYLVHRRIHTGVMPYKCTMCGKSFRYKVSQRTHKCPAQATGNMQQSSEIIPQNIDDKTIMSRMTNNSQENQSAMNDAVTKENKFVLIINAQGQHVLALESEISNISLERKEETVEYKSANETSQSKIWSNNNVSSSELEKSADSNAKPQSDKEKIDIKSASDFFSMVMSPLENSVSSPTFEMEHLRVSSPKTKENSMNSYTDFSEVSDNVQINIAKSNLEESFNGNKDVMDSLQTINEESLKELLYGIDRK